MLAECQDVKNWTFLSKNCSDEYIGLMAQAAGGTVTDTDDFEFERSREPIVLRGILKHKIIKRCWQAQRDFYYVDTGYFDHFLGQRQGRTQKLYHRIVRNNLQHTKIETRPPDRWQRLGIELSARRHGSTIVVAAPDDKPCKFYGIDRDQWTQQVCAEIKQHSDRPIVVRDRSASRDQRTVQDPLIKVLTQDVHAVVTFNSVAAIESILMGVPAFVLCPTHAAGPVANTNLARIDDPVWPTRDLLEHWVAWLAYRQWHVRDVANGVALREEANAY